MAVVIVGMLTVTAMIFEIS